MSVFVLFVASVMVVIASRLYKYVLMYRAGFEVDPDPHSPTSYGSNLQLATVHFAVQMFVAAAFVISFFLTNGFPWYWVVVYAVAEVAFPVANELYLNAWNQKQHALAKIRRKEEAEAAALKKEQVAEAAPAEEPNKADEEFQQKQSALFREMVITKLPEQWHGPIIAAHDEHVVYDERDYYLGRPHPIKYRSAEKLFKGMQNLMSSTLPDLDLLSVGHGRLWEDYFSDWTEDHAYIHRDDKSAFDISEWLHHLYSATGPFADALFAIRVNVEIPHDLRNEHHMIVGGTGHGKTQCLQQMLLDDVQDRNSAVVVIESQGSMLAKMLHVVDEDRLVYLDGGNITHPLALSAFSIGSTSRPEDESKIRNAVALYENLFAAKGAKLTNNQSTLYRFLSRFLMEIPDANFDTAFEILSEGYAAYEQYIEALDSTSQRFVRENLAHPKDRSVPNAYKERRNELSNRLFSIMESRTLKGMFNAPTSKVNIGQAIDERRVILINTSQAVLGEEGASLFGKYCLSQIALTILARPETKERVYLYLDEAQEYLNDSPIIRRLYEQGRKRGLCMVTACQELDQLDQAGVYSLLTSLTSIKFAGGVSAQDASRLAREMDVDVSDVRSAKKFTFICWFKHLGSSMYCVTPGLLEDRINARPKDVEAIKSMMVARYHYAHGDNADEFEETEYDSFWDDTPNEPKTASPDARSDGQSSKPKQPHKPDDIDPDAPQGLDYVFDILHA